MVIDDLWVSREHERSRVLFKCRQFRYTPHAPVIMLRRPIVHEVDSDTPIHVAIKELEELIRASEKSGQRPPTRKVHKPKKKKKVVPLTRQLRKMSDRLLKAHIHRTAQRHRAESLELSHRLEMMNGQGVPETPAEPDQPKDGIDREFEEIFHDDFDGGEDLQRGDSV